MPRRSIPTITAAAAITMLAVAGASAQTTLGPETGMTFGGTGIPNTWVVTNTDTAAIGVTIGLTATQRCYDSPQVCGPVVTNDGVNTFFAQPGESDPGDALWNFDFAAIGPDVNDYDYTLYFDSDPASANGTTGSIPFPIVPFIGIQDSENLGFFPFSLSSPTFDPYASGEYEFDITANDPDQNGLEVARTQMFVDVGSPVPEPGTMSLLALGLVGLAGAHRRRRR